MTTEDAAVLEAMQKYGGGFVQAIAAAASRADAENFARLKAAFPDLWRKYTEIHASAALIRKV